MVVLPRLRNIIHPLKIDIHRKKDQKCDTSCKLPVGFC